MFEQLKAKRQAKVEARKQQKLFEDIRDSLKRGIWTNSRKFERFHAQKPFNLEDFAWIVEMKERADHLPDVQKMFAHSTVNSPQEFERINAVAKWLFNSRKKSDGLPQQFKPPEIFWHHLTTNWPYYFATRAPEECIEAFKEEFPPEYLEQINNKEQANIHNSFKSEQDLIDLKAKQKKILARLERAKIVRDEQEELLEAERGFAPPSMRPSQMKPRK